MNAILPVAYDFIYVALSMEFSLIANFCLVSSFFVEKEGDHTMKIHGKIKDMVPARGIDFLFICVKK